MRKYILIVGLAALCLSGFASASSNIEATVEYAGTYGNGELFINFNKAIDEPGCSTHRVLVVSNHPQIGNWLSIALTAYATKATVNVKTKGCFRGNPTLDMSIDSWFHVR